MEKNAERRQGSIKIMKHLTITLLTLLMACSCFASSVVGEEEEEFKSIFNEIKKDMSHTSIELKKMKQLFQEEYLTIGLPRIISHLQRKLF